MRLPAQSQQRRALVMGLFLGASALVVNLLLMGISLSFPLPLGDIFLFMAAGSLGVEGALAAAAIGVVPLCLITGDSFSCLRLLFITFSISLVLGRSPKIPLFFVITAAWLLVFGPLLSFEDLASPLSILSPFSAATAFGEIVLSIVASNLLMNKTVWAQVCGKERHLSISTITIHALTATASIAMFGGFLILSPLDAPLPYEPLYSGRYEVLALLCFFGVAIPSVLGHTIAKGIADDFRGLNQQGLLSQTFTSAFSGLSSNFWRSQSTTKSSDDLPLSSTTTRLPTSFTRDAGLCVINKNGIVTFINRKFQKFTMESQDSVIGSVFQTLQFFPEFQRSVISLFEDFALKGARINEIRVALRDGSARFYELSSTIGSNFGASSIADAPDSIVLVLKDITERRTVEGHLLQAQKAKTLGESIAAIAYSFNNALTTITGYASLTASKVQESSLKENLDQVITAAANAGRLTNRLLDYAIVNGGHEEYIDLGALLENSETLLKGIVGEGVSIEIETSLEHVAVKANKNLLTQVITNLVLNARESYPDGKGTITIAIDSETIEEEAAALQVGARPGVFARLRVKDSGIGMTVDQMSKAFDPLYTTKGAEGHTGLGLSIVFAIVRGFDGFLNIESQVDKGTTISVYLPASTHVATTSLANIKTSNVDSQTGVESHTHVLLVEDEKEVRTVISKMLKRLGCSVIECALDDHAIQLSQDKNFDLILVDAIFPDVSGREFLNQLKDNAQGSRIVLISSHGSAVTDELSMPVVRKPFDLPTLADVVKGT